MHTGMDYGMHMSVDTAVDNGLVRLVGGIAERVGGQVEPRPAAVKELIEVAGQPLLEVVVLGDGPDGPLDSRRAVHPERHGPDLPRIALRAVVPALHGPDLPGAGVTGNDPAVGPLPLRTARVRGGAGVLPVG